MSLTQIQLSERSFRKSCVYFLMYSNTTSLQDFVLAREYINDMGAGCITFYDWKLKRQQQAKKEEK